LSVVRQGEPGKFSLFRLNRIEIRKKYWDAAGFHSEGLSLHFAMGSFAQWFVFFPQPNLFWGLFKVLNVSHTNKNPWWDFGPGEPKRTVRFLTKSLNGQNRVYDKLRVGKVEPGPILSWLTTAGGITQTGTPKNCWKMGQAKSLFVEEGSWGNTSLSGAAVGSVWRWSGFGGKSAPGEFPSGTTGVWFRGPKGEEKSPCAGDPGLELGRGTPRAKVNARVGGNFCVLVWKRLGFR